MDEELHNEFDKSPVPDSSQNQERRKGGLSRLASRLRRDDAPLRRVISESSIPSHNAEATKTPFEKKLDTAMEVVKAKEKGSVRRGKYIADVINGEPFWGYIEDPDHRRGEDTFTDLAQALIDTRVRNGLEPAISDARQKQTRLDAMKMRIKGGLSSQEYRVDIPATATDEERRRLETRRDGSKSPYEPSPGITEIEIGDHMSVVVTGNETFKNNKFPSYDEPTQTYAAEVISTIDLADRQKLEADLSGPIAVP